MTHFCPLLLFTLEFGLFHLILYRYYNVLLIYPEVLYNNRYIEVKVIFDKSRNNKLKLLYNCYQLLKIKKKKIRKLSYEC